LEYDDFLESVHRFPMLLYPVFVLQQTMRKRIFGQRLWKKLDARVSDLDARSHHWELVRSKWLKRIDCLLTCFTGYPCCATCHHAYQQAHKKRAEEALRREEELRIALAKANGELSDSENDADDDEEQKPAHENKEPHGEAVHGADSKTVVGTGADKPKEKDKEKEHKAGAETLSKKKKKKHDDDKKKPTDKKEAHHKKEGHHPDEEDDSSSSEESDLTDVGSEEYSDAVADN